MYFFISTGFAQEELRPLPFNPALSKELQATAKKLKNVTFLVDTLDLPFIDDFSINHLKNYSIDENNPNIITTNWSKYTHLGNAFDTLPYMIDTTWTFYIDPGTSDTDSVVANAPLIVEEYLLDYQSTFYQEVYLWPPYNTIVLGNVIIAEEFIADTFLLNIFDTLIVFPDDNSLWMENDVFVNTGYAVDPITIGVATFDGLDSLGHPRDFSSESSYGISDYLTSKPLDLEGKSDVRLSFFYQPQGLGNDPNPEDSLVLEFYSKEDLRWNHVFTVIGQPLKDFTYVQFAITNPKYLVRGFQFRLKNYATLSGSLDHWNVDYFWLDADRIATGKTIPDVGFTKGPGSFLEGYSAMPYHHYTAQNMKSATYFTQRNMDDVGKTVTLRYEVYEEDWTSIYQADEKINGSFPDNAVDSVSFDINTGVLPFEFPPMTEPTTFIVQAKNRMGTEETYHENDTVYYYQHFDNYYAYDDGTPEQAYGLNGVGAKVAMEYNLEVAEDTLRAIQMYLPKLFDGNSNSFKITVWSSENNAPEDTLYQGTGQYPIFQTSDEPIAFHRYELERPIAVSGKFFVGFEQNFDEKIWVGFDANTNMKAYFWYNTGNYWITTQYNGCLMIRPDFGYSEIAPIYQAVNDASMISELVNMYPNPASDELVVDLLSGGPIELKITSMYGVTVLSEILEQSTVINMSNIAAGTYLVTSYDQKNNRSFTKRLVIVK